MRVEEIVRFEQTDADEYELVVYDEETVHRLLMNTHTAADLYDAVVAQLGRYIGEREEARRTMPKREPDENGPWPGESALDFYRRTGDDEPLRESGDYLRKAAREA